MAMEARKKGKKEEKERKTDRKKDKLEPNQEDPKVECLPAKTCGYEACAH